MQGLERGSKATGEATLSGLSVGGNSRLDTANILPVAISEMGALWAAKRPANSQDPYRGHRHHFWPYAQLCFMSFSQFIKSLSISFFESSSKLAELNRDQVRGKASGRAPDYSISQGCCEGGGATGESTMATLVVWRPYVRGQLAELCSSNLDLIKPFSPN